MLRFILKTSFVATALFVSNMALAIDAGTWKGAGFVETGTVQKPEKRNCPRATLVLAQTATTVTFSSNFSFDDGTSIEHAPTTAIVRGGELFMRTESGDIKIGTITATAVNVHVNLAGRDVTLALVQNGATLSYDYRSVDETGALLRESAILKK